MTMLLAVAKEILQLGLGILSYIYFRVLGCAPVNHKGP